MINFEGNLRIKNTFNDFLIDMTRIIAVATIQWAVNQRDVMQTIPISPSRVTLHLLSLRKNNIN